MKWMNVWIYTLISSGCDIAYSNLYNAADNRDGKRNNGPWMLVFFLKSKLESKFEPMTHTYVSYSFC